MEGFDSSAIQLELKYCERCGGLWLRPQGSDLIFCGACAKASAHILGWPRPCAGITTARRCRQSRRFLVGRR